MDEKQFKVSVKLMSKIHKTIAKILYLYYMIPRFKIVVENEVRKKLRARMKVYFYLGKKGYSLEDRKGLIK